MPVMQMRENGCVCLCVWQMRSYGASLPLSNMCGCGNMPNRRGRVCQDFPRKKMIFGNARDANERERMCVCVRQMRIHGARVPLSNMCGRGNMPNSSGVPRLSSRAVVAVIVDAVPSVVGPLEESAEEIRHLVLGPGPPAVNVLEDRAAAEGLAQRARLVAHHVAVGAAAVQAEDARGRGGAHVERFGVCVCELLLLELLMRRVGCARELRDAEGVERHRTLWRVKALNRNPT